MGMMRVCDNVIWAKHIEGNPSIQQHVLALQQDASLTLLIEDFPLRCVKMRDGADGRPTPGLKPADSLAKATWSKFLEERRGEFVRVRLKEDPDIGLNASLSGLLSEWESEADSRAYDGL